MKKEGMYCPQCRCEFPGWIRTCPHCKTPLVSELPNPETIETPLSYEALVDVVRKNGGQLRIDVTTTDVGMEREWRFPYQGYGFAWVKRMQGFYSDISVDLTTCDVGKSRKWRFPYNGYGFAWAKKMEGYIGGNEATLAVKKVEMEKKWRFPYLGYGYAWTQEMSGECGDQLAIDLMITDVGRKNGWGFPYRGYGFAWARKGILTITLKR